jgi:hypothetical protein
MLYLLVTITNCSSRPRWEQPSKLAVRVRFLLAAQLQARPMVTPTGSQQSAQTNSMLITLALLSALSCGYLRRPWDGRPAEAAWTDLERKRAGVAFLSGGS